MNKVILMGRLTRNPDVRYSQGEKATCVARYTLAVNRRFRREGDQDADFINRVLRLSFPEEFRQVVIPIVTVLRYIQQMLLLKNRILRRVRQLLPAIQVDISSREAIRVLQSHRLHLHRQTVQPQVRQ